MNDTITTDGVSRITNSSYGMGFGQALNGVLDTQNAWRVDSLGAQRNAETIEAIGDNHVAIEKVGAADQIATEKTAAATQLALSLASSNTNNLLISGFKDGRYDAAVNAAAVALASATNTAAIQKNIDDCCCEMKAAIDDTEDKILDDGQKTRDLINQLEDLHHAVELADLKIELALAKGNGTTSK